MGNLTENVLFKSFRRRIKKERKLFLFVLTFALYTVVLHADWWFQKLINSSPTTTKMFFDGHYKMMIRTNSICSDGKPFSFRQKMLNLYTTETSSNVTCEYWMNKILLSYKFIYVVPVVLSINIPSSAKYWLKVSLKLFAYF